MEFGKPGCREGEPRGVQISYIQTMRHVSDLKYDLWLTRCALCCVVWMPR